MLNEIKWATRQRLEYIERIAYYTGVVTRSDVAKAFAISDAAATKDLKYYGDIAPENLIYKHTVFGFVPSEHFQAVFADLSPEAVLPMLEANLTVSGGPVKDQLVFAITAEGLPLPNRLPAKEILAEVTRAIHNKKKLQVRYLSLSGRNSNDERVIEPHSLINTGFRWHARAYNEDTFDFRDFVLSRLIEAKELDIDAESGEAYDDDWVEMVTLTLSPHPKLDEIKQRSLMIDYGIEDTIEIKVRRALIAYVLQRLSVDTTPDHHLNPNKHQLIVANRDEIEPFASWAFE